MRNYCAAFMPEDDGRYSVFFADLPGCQTMGDTLDDAFTQAADALTLYLESRADLGYPIPGPSDMVTARAKIAAEMKDIGETVPAGTVIVLTF